MEIGIEKVSHIVVTILNIYRRRDPLINHRFCIFKCSWLCNKMLIIGILIVSISLSSDICLFERVTIVYEISFVHFVFYMEILCDSR